VSSLNHPHIATLHDVGEHSGRVLHRHGARRGSRAR
jgi:hypothetical protein